MVKHRKPKPRKVVKIDYPPLTLRKWKPPKRDQPHDPKTWKPPRMKYTYPPKLHTHSEPTSLGKVWHNFRYLGHRTFVLSANLSENHDRFLPKSRGKQCSCACTVAVAFSQLVKMELWSSEFLDATLVLGDRLYARTVLQLGKDHGCCIEPCKVFPSFYFRNVLIHMRICKTDTVQGMLVRENEAQTLPSLLEVLETFFELFSAGIIWCQDRAVAFWRTSSPPGAFFYFDPHDRDEFGCRLDGFAQKGRAVLMRFGYLQALADQYVHNFTVAANNPENCTFCLTPVSIRTTRLISLSCPKDAEEMQRQAKMTKSELELILTGGDDWSRRHRKPPPPPEPEPEPEEPPPPPPEPKDEDDEKATDYVPQEGEEPLVRHQEIPADKKPRLVPSTTSVNYFMDVHPGFFGILRGGTHQCDPNIRNWGKQELSNAIAALVTLRMYKSKNWITDIVNDVLKLSQHIFHKLKKERKGETSFKLMDFNGLLIEVDDFRFKPDINEFAAYGQLNSLNEMILDLLGALKVLFNYCDALIIMGPLVLAVWQENGFYYMYDPNERDELGLVCKKKPEQESIAEEPDCLSQERIIQSISLEPGDQNSPELKPLKKPPPGGRACVTWYKYLKDLVAMYKANLPRERKFDRFHIAQVKIEDYADLPEDWYNFKAISANKWILTGSFNQGDLRFGKESRNTQCTANACVALAFARSIDVKDWDSGLLDEMLVTGDELYLKTVAYLKEKNKFKDKRLMTAEVCRKFMLMSKEVNLKIDDCLINGLLYGNGSLTLREGLEAFFKDYEMCVVTTRGLSMALWKDADSDNYFYFDSHGRGEDGLPCVNGTSCVILTKTVEALTRILLSNLSAGDRDDFNISKIEIELKQVNEDGSARPALNNYLEIDYNRAILRADLSQLNEKYKLASGKQTIPNLLTAIGMRLIMPASEWDKEMLLEILDFGDKYYDDSSKEFTAALLKASPNENLDKDASGRAGGEGNFELASEKLENARGGGAGFNYFRKYIRLRSGGAAPDDQSGDMDDAYTEDANEDEDSDAITTSNVLKEFTLGVNKFNVEYETVQNGVIEIDPELRAKTSKLEVKDIRDIVKAMYPDEESTEIDESKAILIESKCCNVAFWYENGAWYLFDPGPRDETGHVYGKDEWSLRSPLLIPSTYDFGEEEEEEEEPEGDDDIVDDEDEDEVAPKPKPVAIEPVPPVPEIDMEKEILKMIGDEYGEGAEEEGEVLEEPIPKMGSAYWRNEERVNGRACVLLITKLDLVLDHVIDNVPPARRDEECKVITVVLKDSIADKEKYEAQKGVPKEDPYLGDWYNFKEMDKYQWILRGTIDVYNVRFPEGNRGKQAFAVCCVANAFGRFYAMQEFTTRYLDCIVKYGDRLYTATMREASGGGLVAKKFAIGPRMIGASITTEYFVGDVTAKEHPVVLDVRRALEQFFEENRFAVISSKDLTVAVFKGTNMYYMFDPFTRDSVGVRNTIGTCCLTRFLNLKDLEKLFLTNLPKEGGNRFAITKLEFTEEEFVRDKKVVEKLKCKDSVPKLSTFRSFAEGKTILCANLSCDDDSFKMSIPGASSLVTCVVALAMKCAHKPATWTKPILDEIVLIGNELYNISSDALQFQFNPWEDPMQIDQIMKEFQMGSLRANFQIMEADQTGVISIKHPNILNLRRGIEEFLKENEQGVIQTETQNVAIWEDPSTSLIYMFDPNPRGNTGFCCKNGKACSLTFNNAKLASDHFIANILDADQRKGKFVITPLEFVLEECDKKRKRATQQQQRIKTTRCQICNRKRRPSKRGEAQQDQTPGYMPLTKFFTRCTMSGVAQAVPVKCVCPVRAQRDGKDLDKSVAADKTDAKSKQRRQMKYQVLCNGDAVMRGDSSAASKAYPEYCRGKQSLTCAVAFLICSKVVDMQRWNHNHIDLVMVLGEHLYRSAYLAARGAEVDLQHLDREFYFTPTIKVRMDFYQPCIRQELTEENVARAFNRFFTQESIAMIKVKTEWLAVVQTASVYYLFDAGDRDAAGKRTQAGRGRACVVRHPNLNALVNGFVAEFHDRNESVDFEMNTADLDSTSFQSNGDKLN